MTPAQRKLVVELLDMAADHYGNHGCNDFILTEHGLTPDESREVLERLNAHDAIHNPGCEHNINDDYAEDWVLMAWLAHILEDE